MQLVDQFNSSFKKNLYILGIFINLSKAFDTVDHKILITNLENYTTEGTSLQWFKRYLKNCWGITLLCLCSVNMPLYLCMSMTSIKHLMF